MTALRPLRMVATRAWAPQVARFSATPLARTVIDPAISYDAFRSKNESDERLRARLLYQSRYRGTLESDLLLSTFAASHLPRMTRAELDSFDAFLQEEDWNIYYWAPQDVLDTTPAGSPSEEVCDPTPAAPPRPTEDTFAREPIAGEWGRMAGNFRAAHRGVPERWRNSPLLRALREHVRERSGREGGMAARPLLSGEGTEKGG